MTPFILTLAPILAIVVGGIAGAQDTAAGLSQHRREWERSGAMKGRLSVKPRRPGLVIAIYALLALMVAAMSQVWVFAVLALSAVTVVVGSYAIISGNRDADSSP